MKLFNQFLALGATTALAASALAQTHVTANITANTTWTVSGSPYILEGVTYVTSGAILDIEPGVVIRGQPRVVTSIDTTGALVITPGSQIQARGTAAAPIIMTTAAVPDGIGFRRWAPADGTGSFLDATPSTNPLAPTGVVDRTADGSVTSSDKTMQLWGGLVLSGFAQTNNAQDVDGDLDIDDGQGLIEGLTGANAIYGGSNDLDNSGVVQYVSIRHGGDGVVGAQEINALTLYSVGSGTTINYVDVYCTSDDGVEVFGGAVNLDHLNVNYADDDGFDTDEGYRGTAEFIFVLQGNGYGDMGMELDGDEWDVSQSTAAPIFPVSDVQIRNATVVIRSSPGSDVGVLMRNGFNGALINSIVWKQGTASTTGVVVEPVNTGDTAPGASDYFDTGSLQLRGVTVWNFSTYYNVTAVAGNVDISGAGAVTGTYEGVSIPSVYFPATNNRGSTSTAFDPEFTVTDGTLVDCIPNPAKTGAIGSVQPLAYVRDPGTFASYRGAFNPTASQQWTFGWTALNIDGVLAN